MVKLNDLVEKIKSQEARLEKAFKHIEVLNTEVSQLKAHQTLTTSLMFVKDRVIEELSSQVNKMQQYSRRYSCIIKGVPKPNRESKDTLKAEIESIIQDIDCGIKKEDVDKFHRNGPRHGDSQDIIVRFKSHSAKEEIYRNRKNLGNEDIKIQPSLTEQNRTLLSKARDVLQEEYFDIFETLKTPLVNPPEFVMANVHGSIQVKMKEKHKNRLFFEFDTINQLREIISQCNVTFTESHYDKLLDEFNVPLNDVVETLTLPKDGVPLIKADINAEIIDNDTVVVDNETVPIAAVPPVNAELIDSVDSETVVVVVSNAVVENNVPDADVAN